LLAACEQRFPDGLPTGQAGWTQGFDLPARWVIHVVGPIHGVGERAQLVSCYANALAVADELRARTVAFPLISAGVYGWPRDDAIAAAVDTLRASPASVEEARMVAFGRPTYEAIARHLRR
jgi:O-acetyl-ADP-ribose deacetylase (regulator of RNase III)